MRFAWFPSKRAAYRRLLAEVVDHEVVREAEEIVGAAWMAGLMEAAEAAESAGRSPGRVRPGNVGVGEFVNREREMWATAAKARAMAAIADRERLAEAARAAGIRDGSIADLLR